MAPFHHSVCPLHRGFNARPFPLDVCFSPLRVLTYPNRGESASDRFLGIRPLVHQLNQLTLTLLSLAIDSHSLTALLHAFHSLTGI
jgi:hypothetical protein